MHLVHAPWAICTFAVRRFQASGAREPRTSGRGMQVGPPFHDPHTQLKHGGEWVVTSRTCIPIIALTRFAM
ncbi:hypothetical protein BS17DRAFT_193894 [Gyrodon lividus]|nr:hypothetical protein BS17DRAFT_193894 [Gyrodon lividus]